MTPLFVLSGFMAAGFTKAAGGINGLFENVDGPSLGNTIKAAVLGGTASVIGGGKFANGAITGAMSRALNDEGGDVAQKGNNLRNTPEELEMLENGNVVGYYESRLARGDQYAKLALNVVRNEGVLAKSANAWMFTQVTALSTNEMQALLNGGTYVDFIRRVNVGLADAHATFVDADTRGTLGLLSADQISTYHEQFFTSVGLPAATFGGSFFFGVRTSYWCDGCDSVP